MRISFCRAWVRPVLVCVACAFSSIVQAQIHVPAGARLSVGSGALDAGGADLIAGGQVWVQSGNLIGLRHVEIEANGSLDNGSGQITLAGDWNNAGSFAAGSGRVSFVDGLGLVSAAIIGNSAFANLAFSSVSGKNFSFMAGSVQTIAGALEILGVSGSPLQFRSTIPGQVASINLLPGGSQNIAHVGVSDVYAIGQPLAPDLSNEGGSGNDFGWFGNTPLAEMIDLPTLSPVALMLLALLLAALALRARGYFHDPENGERA